jgi:hypothetical protein
MEMGGSTLHIPTPLPLTNRKTPAVLVPVMAPIVTCAAAFGTATTASPRHAVTMNAAEILRELRSMLSLLSV